MFANRGLMTPRTQKVTFGFRSAARPRTPGRTGDRNGVFDGDRVLINQDFLHQQTEDLLPFCYIHCLGMFP